MQKEAARLSIVEESRTLINKTLNAFVSTVSQVKPNMLIIFTIKEKVILNKKFTVRLEGKRFIIFSSFCAL